MEPTKWEDSVGGKREILRSATGDCTLYDLQEMEGRNKNN
jgi:hypothetical protein